MFVTVLIINNSLFYLLTVQCTNVTHANKSGTYKAVVYFMLSIGLPPTSEIPAFQNLDAIETCIGRHRTITI